ncbi:PEPxxWA-CTERM sorting domain-containing protein [Sphingomonas sp. BIUV-7]|uniref:PEPxxWA-CTERM sorting domain-containing protein n=1 Tax=Sphingomonas natans TaxID=3063330 RepID=A0ABT8YD83_9SPHN|nr:PEPxxWA-CTERM sorting domain-containing protein [Sphingomonas sp. BIUV-7]MDO6416331.1 PEPxxWA-CTERM sorting domain-containing protein [Sphingomonas sp. BIUV-7]
MKNYALAAVAAVSFAVSGVASATVVQVTPGSMQGWSNPADENAYPGHPLGSATITGGSAHDGDGSIELKGERSRFVVGTLYPNAASASFGLLSTFASLTFDWKLAADSVATLNPLYTPALRFTIYNGSIRKELIWEGVYNNTYNTTSKDVWYSTSAADNFYITGGSVNDGKSIADWAADASLANYVVKGISVGQGSSAGDGFHAYADNVSYAKTDGSVTTFKFDLTAAASDVPEPATWGMMIVGFGMVGGSLRRRKTTIAFG